MPGSKHILYIGNKLVEHGRTPTKIATLGPLLEAEGHALYYSSNKMNKLTRLLDMLSSINKLKSKVDVVFIDTYSTTAFYFAWLCGWLCRRLGVKYIPILNGGNLPERFKKSPQLCRQLFGGSHMNIATSAYLQEAMLREGYRSILIENNIELKNYTYKQRHLATPRLLWVRAFHETYNPAMAVEVVTILQKKYPDVHLTMVGPDLDGSMQECKHLAKEKGVEAAITFTGKMPKEVWKELAAEHDIFINTTNFDNFPISVVEAMALGLPVVTTNVGGIPYLLKHEETAFLVDANDAGSMSAAVETLMQNQELTERLSTNGRELAEQFDWQIIKDKWAALLSKI